MTAAEKALKLTQEFQPHSHNWEHAKENAMFCVQEIQQALDAVDWSEVQNLDRVHKWWDDVITEINKMA